MRAALRVLVVLAAVGFATVVYVWATLPDVRSLATDNPTTTAFMVLRAREAAAAGRELPHRHEWVPYAQIPADVRRAALIAEDDAFFQHEGVDYVQLRRALEESWQNREPLRGASTITQLLAKNLDLSPARSPVRKFRELVIARRLEAALSKERILELYLNVIEWGDGVWGIGAAARAHFGVPASALTRRQAALLAGAIINPRVYSPSAPSRRLLARQDLILARLGGAGPDVEAPLAVEPATPAPRPVLEALPADRLPQMAMPAPFPAPAE
jgi:monofunctional biosynthetic peptidoglycan transglycosylase